MRSKSLRLISVALVVAVVLLGGNIMLLARSEPAQAAVTINRDRIKNVIYPTFGYPSITKCGERMTIEFDPRDQDWSKPLPELDAFQVTATTTNSQYPLLETLKVNYYYIAFSTRWPEYSQQANPKAQIYLVNVTVPEDMPVHLYDLTVVALNNGSTVLTDSQPHALQTVVDFSTTPQFAQLTDIHVWGPEAWYPGACTIERNYRHETYSTTDGYGATYYHKTIQQLNVEKPDFIVYTGDYDFSQKWLYQENYASFSQYASSPWNGKYYEPWFEMDWFYQESLKLNVPVFMVMGNHDGYARYDFFNTKCEEDYANSWRDLFGPQYYSFDYGSDYHFTAADAMDWDSINRNLHWAIPNVILSPGDWQGQVRGGGDPFQAGWSQAREDAINMDTFTGQLMWLREDLEAHPGAKIRTVLIHHDPWKQAGSGVMFDDPGGQGAGRLAVIKLCREYNVALVLSGHDHSDEYGSIAWEHDGGNIVNFVNTTCVMLHDAASVLSQDFTHMTEYPGYRLVRFNDTHVVNYNYVAPYLSWPVYANTNVGGETNYNNLSAPSVETAWTTVAPDDLRCLVTNHLVGAEYTPGTFAGDLNGAGLEFAMPYLNSGYYYQVAGGTFGEVFDNNETSPDHRIYEVSTNVPHSSAGTVEVSKSASPDTTAPTCTDFHITMTDQGVREVTVVNDATDLESGMLDMKLWNDGQTEADAEWQRWEPSTKWRMRNEAGERTVYVKFRDRAMPGNVSIEYHAHATLVGPAPVITDVPVSARVGDSVVLTGTDFGTQSESDMVQFNGVLANVTDWQNTQITCDVPVGASSGTVTVTNDGGSGDHAFTVLPTLQYVEPDSGYNNGVVHIEDLHGTGLASGVGYPQVKLTDGTHEIVGTNVQLVSPESVSCDFDLAGATVGDYGIQLENADHSTDLLESCFSVDYPPPELQSITPSTGINNAPVAITDIAGDHFRAGMSVFLTKDADTITATDVQVVSAQKATCTLDLTGAATGQWDVWVQNDDGEAATLSQAFTIGFPAPAVTAITPSSGFINGSVPVTNLAGANFRAGATVKLSDGTSEIAATDVTVVSPTKITCNIDLAGAAAGAWDVVVLNDDAKSGALAGGFQVKWSTTHVDAITPDAGKTGDQVTISGSNFGAKPGGLTFGGTAVQDVVSWNASQIVCKVPVGASGASPVIVTSTTGPSNAAGFTATQPSWFLAEGSTDWGFSTYITVANPNDATATIDVTYMTPAGPVAGGALGIKGQSQLTINPSSVVGSKDFSTKITCREGLDIACDRTMTWNDAVEGHSSVGVAGPAKTWFMPEGCSAYGFETWLLVQNPGGAAAHCNITYMIEGEGPKTVAKTVPASSRASFSMESDIGKKSASIRVDSDVPVIPERSVYRNNRGEGSDSIGTTVPATDYFLAEGSTNWGFTTYVLVQNPNGAAASVTLTYMTPKGAVAKGPFSVPGFGRTTFRANDQVPNSDISVKVQADKPIVAERSMFWNNGAGEACHDSIGLAQTHTSFCLPDGQTSDGRQTYMLVQNPNGQEVSIRVTYMTDTSGGNVVFDDKVPANSRKTYDMSKQMSAGRASVLVECLTAGKKIMVERSMYWNSKRAGTESIGSYSD